MIPWILFVCFTYAFPVSGRSAGILYEVWHAEASTASKETPPPSRPLKAIPCFLTPSNHY
eukprot:m.120840 g.120840  ORF g.120840 m.120840 type:complete len:60 (-) comp23253_c0_seq5:1845-2024(-)